MVYIPFSQLEIKDSWYVTGMQGTGSDTSVAKDVFVPDHLMVMMDKPFGYVEPGKKHYGAPSDRVPVVPVVRSEAHTSELQSLLRISYAVFCLKKKIHNLDIHK